ncbi:hypothetical protein SRABI76_01506 [Microbacterium oxydans]|uniref:Uncharacterized protein n=1 Tax=Microbacterium oxydans TaxID=82380 RepID=A0A0F0L681_9MICO|nr:hypothetical protein [Microbacterium oxydans]KJL27810.1 hypothetical protein RS83_02865 [Microbacterium oxydans]CAH0179955.1 hypothetical protein SRABI76_01506 [Microbacterium oxydans]
MSVNEHDIQSGAGMKRRTVIKAAAWSAPVVAVAIATPMAAASVARLQTAPGGGLSVWQGSTSVGTFTVAQPNRVQVNTGQSVGFSVMDIDTGEDAAAGLYTSGVVTVTVQWGAGSGVPTPSSYRLEERNLNGWTRVGSLPDAGTTGSVQYVYTGLLNGSANVVPLPVVWLYPTAGGALTPSYVNTVLSAEHLSEKTSGARVP